MAKQLKTMAVLAAGLLILLSIPARAQTAQEMPDESQAFIQELAEKTLAVLDDIRLTQEERDTEFHRLLAEGFEIPYLSKLVLGRHRKTATSGQMAEFQQVFPDYIIKIYADRLKEYGDERFYVTGTYPAGKKDIYVQSQVTRAGREPFSADWRVRWMNEQLSIIDIKISGISMLQTQRDEFSSRINQVGFDGLLTEMRDKTYGQQSRPASTGND